MQLRNREKSKLSIFENPIDKPRWLKHFPTLSDLIYNQIFCRVTAPRPFILGEKNAFCRDSGLPYTSLSFEFYLPFLYSHQFGLQTCIPPFFLDSQIIPLFGVDPCSCYKEVIANIQKELRLLSYCTTSMGYNDHINFQKWWETRYKELIQSAPTEEKGKQCYFIYFCLFSASY